MNVRAIVRRTGDFPNVTNVRKSPHFVIVTSSHRHKFTPSQFHNFTQPSNHPIIHPITSSPLHSVLLHILNSKVKISQRISRITLIVFFLQAENHSFNSFIRWRWFCWESLKKAKRKKEETKRQKTGKVTGSHRHKFTP